MSANDPWKAGDEVYRTMQSLIASRANLTPLASIDDQILIVFKPTASTNGDVTIPGKTAKANALLGVVSEKSYTFVITLAADVWQELSDAHREALLFHHLCACGVEENPESGDMRFYVRIPDVAFFREEVENYGFWRTTGSTPEPNLVQELFGDRPVRKTKTKKGGKKGGKTNP